MAFYAEWDRLAKEREEAEAQRKAMKAAAAALHG